MKNVKIEPDIDNITVSKPAYTIPKLIELSVDKTATGGVIKGMENDDTYSPNAPS